MFYGISRKKISINFTATIQRKIFSVIYSEIPLKFSLRSFRKLLTRGHTAKYFKTSGRTLLESDYKPVKQCFNIFHINFDQDVLPIVRRRSSRNFWTSMVHPKGILPGRLHWTTWKTFLKICLTNLRSICYYIKKSKKFSEVCNFPRKRFTSTKRKYLKITPKFRSSNNISKFCFSELHKNFS